MKITTITFIILVLNGVIDLGAESASTQSFFATLIIDKCEGKYSGNYTIIETGVAEIGNCQDTLEISPILHIIQCGPKGERTISSALRLAGSNFPNGATSFYTHLDLVISGPLQGTYILLRQEYTRLDHLKTCSSVLGKSVNYNANIELVITDKLDLNALISNNPYESSKNGSDTICRGYLYVV